MAVVGLAGCRSDEYAPPRTHDSQRKELSFHAVAGAEWDSIGVLRPYETCSSQGWTCTVENRTDTGALLLVWSDGSTHVVRLPGTTVALGEDVPAVLRPSQRLCYIDGPEPQALLYAC